MAENFAKLAKVAEHVPGGRIHIYILGLRELEMFRKIFPRRETASFHLNSKIELQGPIEAEKIYRWPYQYLS